MSNQPRLLTLNPGSSSLKASVRSPQVLLSIQVERLGTSRGRIAVTAGEVHTEDDFTGDVADAVGAVAKELRERDLPIDGVSHRVVHGGPHHYRPTLIDDALVADLRDAVPLAPLHLPGNIEAITQARRSWPRVSHIACFDTGFHHDLPERSRRLPVPDELTQRGVRRYGFHGLSIQSVLHARPDIGQAVIAHLGSGCSVTAVAEGGPRHTTMSLTPTGGMLSATRTGDLDPEIVLYLIQQHGYGVDRLRDLFDHESGLAGIAQGRHDLRDLQSSADPSANLAFDMFADGAAMAIAACATTLENFQTLVFTGGAGENSARLREAIAVRLLSLRGLSRDSPPTPEVALAGSGLDVIVVPADEEGVLDRLCRQLLVAEC